MAATVLPSYTWPEPANSVYLAPSWHCRDARSMVNEHGICFIVSIARRICPFPLACFPFAGTSTTWTCATTPMAYNSTPSSRWGPVRNLPWVQWRCLQYGTCARYPAYPHLSRLSHPPHRTYDLEQTLVPKLQTIFQEILHPKVFPCLIPLPLKPFCCCCCGRGVYNAFCQNLNLKAHFCSCMKPANSWECRRVI